MPMLESHKLFRMIRPFEEIRLLISDNKEIICSKRYFDSGADVHLFTMAADEALIFVQGVIECTREINRVTALKRGRKKS